MTNTSPRPFWGPVFRWGNVFGNHVEMAPVDLPTPTGRYRTLDGLRGIYVRRYQCGKVVYRVLITYMGKTEYIGKFDHPSEAIAARNAFYQEKYGPRWEQLVPRLRWARRYNFQQAG